MDTLQITDAAGVRTITLNRPDALNAVTEQMTTELQSALKDVVKNRELWSEEHIEKTANYYPTPVPGQPAKTELDGRKEAITKIADEILARSIQGW